MRNTHFGGGEGFSKFKQMGNTAALVAAAIGSVFEQIDSDRNKVSRKRGAKTTNTRNDDIRDSQSKLPTSQIAQPLNRSIIMNQNGSGD